MMKVRPSEQPITGTSGPRRTLDGGVDVRRQFMLAGGWRIADLLEMNPRSPAMLDALRQIHQAACEVIGGNLSRRSLDRDGLQRLQDSVTRQADQARQLQRKLAVVATEAGLQEEVAELIKFFDSASADIARKLGSRH